MPSEQERAAAEAERQRNELEKQEIDRQIQFAVGALLRALNAWRQADVSCHDRYACCGDVWNSCASTSINRLTRLQDTIGLFQWRMLWPFRAMFARCLSRRISVPPYRDPGRVTRTDSGCGQRGYLERALCRRACAGSPYPFVNDTRRDTDGSLVIVRNAV